MRILMVGRGSDHASTRVRLLQYREPLERTGFDVRFLPWQPKKTADVARLTLSLLRAARWADVVMIVKPRLHPKAMATLVRVNPNVVVDIDDAMWTWGDVFAERFDLGASSARAITAGSHFLTTQMHERYGNAVSVRIPSAVALDDYSVRGDVQDPGPVVVGWIGNTASLSDFSDPVVSALRRAVDADLVTVRIVSSRPLEGVDLRTDFEPWSSATETDSLRSFDVGIMPLHDDERSWGRCGYKAVQCMAVGVPVVASPIGAAPEIIDGGNGLLASTEDEWFEALERLAISPELRIDMGRRARRTIEDDFSVEANLPRLVAAFEAAAR